MKYRRDVDGLRALAIGSVMLVHGLHDAFPNGYLGVDIFFVISGFVITLSLVRRDSSSLGNFVTAFYARRFLRLLPALILVLLVTTFAISMLNPRPSEFLKTALAASFGFGNVQLYLAEQDYFAESAALNPFTHTWSLGVEEQFYLVIPLLLWGTTKYTSLHVFGKVVGALFVVSLAGWLWIGNTDPETAFYLMPFRLWELAAGVLIAVHSVTRAGTRPEMSFKSSGRLGAACVIVLILIVLFPAELPLAPTTLAVVLCTGGVLLADTSPSTVGRVLTSSAVNLVGRASYSIYLWHWPLLVLARWSIGSSPAIAIGLLGLSILLGILTMTLVENPVRFGLNPSPRFAVFAGFAVMTIAAAVPAVIGKTTPPLYLGQPPNMVAIGTPSLQARYVAGDGTTWQGPPCILSSDEQKGKRIDVENCTFGNTTTSTRRILVLGNSYSAAFVPSFAEVAVAANALVTVTSSWGASPVSGVANYTPWSEANDHYWGSIVPELLENLAAGDFVFLISDLSAFSSIHGSQSVDRLADLEAGLKAFSEQLSQRGINTAILGPLPFLREANCDPAMAAPQWFAPNGAPCSFFSKQDTIAAQEPLRTVLENLEDEKYVSVLDLEEVFCPSDVCTFFDESGTILYRDQYSHPSVEAAINSAPNFLVHIGADTPDAPWQKKGMQNAVQPVR